MAAQLKLFSARGFFAVDGGGAIPHDAIEYIAQQLGVRADDLSCYDFSGRTARRYCVEILQYLGFRRMQRSDREPCLSELWAIFARPGQSIGTILDAVFLGCRDRNIYGPSAKKLERLVRSQRQRYLDGQRHEASAAPHIETIALMVEALTDADAPTGVNAMKSRCGSRRQIDAILVTKLSRWGRSTIDLLNTLSELESWKVSVIAMNGMTFDLSSPLGRMLATFLTGNA